jgi:putative FmdB family regulatory protein
MPLYEYECKQCKQRTEKIQKFSDPEITECPHCGGLLERVLSAPAISFKGGGWFADGYGNAKPSAGSSESKGDSGKSINASSDSGSSKSDAAGAPPSTTPASTPSAPAAPASSSSDKK